MMMISSLRDPLSVVVIVGSVENGMGQVGGIRGRGRGEVGAGWE